MTLDGTEVLALRRACARFNVVGALNVYLLEQTGSFDASILVGTAGRLFGVSKMVHATQRPCFYEQSYYAPSDEGFHVYETAVGKVGIVMCFDHHYPECIRCCVLQGAELILIPTANLQGEPLEMFEWELRVAAFHNSVDIVMCNRVGQEDAVTFYGQSVVVGPDGQVIVRVGEGEQILTADIDLEFVRSKWRQNKYLELRRAWAFQIAQP